MSPPASVATASSRSLPSDGKFEPGASASRIYSYRGVPAPVMTNVPSSPCNAASPSPTSLPGSTRVWDLQVGHAEGTSSPSALCLHRLNACHPLHPENSLPLFSPGSSSESWTPKEPSRLGTLCLMCVVSNTPVHIPYFYCLVCTPALHSTYTQPPCKLQTPLRMYLSTLPLWEPDFVNGTQLPGGGLCAPPGARLQLFMRKWFACAIPPTCSPARCKENRA